MMKNKVSFYLVVSCLFFSGISFAGMESEIGLSFIQPEGWELSRISRKQIWMEDTTGRFSAQFIFTVYDKIDTLSDGPEDWVEIQGIVRTIQLETHECYGMLWAIDTILQDGLFSMLVNAEEGDCLEDPVQVYRAQSRYVANGNFGWDLTVIADSADMVESYELYIDFLDSVKIVRSFAEIKQTIVNTRSMVARDKPVFSFSGDEIRLHEFAGWNNSGGETISLRLYRPNGKVVNKYLIKQLPFDIHLKRRGSVPSYAEIKIIDGKKTSNSGPTILRLR